MEDITAQQLAQGLDAMLRLVEDGLQGNKKIAVQLAQIETKLTVQDREIRLLNKMVKDGNGSPSFSTRLSVLESGCQSCSSSLSTLNKVVKTNDKDIDARLDIMENNLTALRTKMTILLGGISVLIPIVTTLINHFIL